MNRSEPFEALKQSIAESQELANDIGSSVFVVGENLDVIPGSKFVAADYGPVHWVSWPLGFRYRRCGRVRSDVVGK